MTPGLPSPSPPSPWRAPLATVFAVALVVRAAVLWQLAGSPVTRFLIGDAATYDAWARDLLANGWLGREVFYQSPLYPYLMGALYAVAGPSPMAVRVVQVVLGAGSCALIARAGRDLFGPAAGLAAGLLLAFYPPAVYFDVLIQKSSVDAFLLCLALAGLARGLERPSPARFAGVGLALGVLLLSRENALLVVLAAVLFLLLHFREEPLRRRAGWGGALALAAALPVLPVAARNAYLGGELVPTTYAFGPSLFIGNARGADGMYVALRPDRGDARYERQDATELAEAAVGHALRPTEVSRYWARRAMEEIGADPGRWLRLVWRKWLLVWNGAELGDAEDVYTYGEEAPLLGLPLRVFGFGTLLALAALGAVLTAAEWRRLGFLHLTLAAYAVSVTIFFVFARYRYPLVPPLVLLAAGGLARLPEVAAERRRRLLAAGGAAAIAAAAVSSLTLVAPGELRAPSRYNLGNHLAAAGELPAALAQYDRALAEKPDYRAASFNRAGLLARLGRRDEAVLAYRRHLGAFPDDAASQTNLAALLVESGRPAEGAALLRQALAADDSPRAWFNYGFATAAAGDRDEARRALLEALRRDPRFFPALYQLGRVLEASGQRAEAAQAYRAALEVQPGSPEAAAALRALGAP
ncbi:MAG TPA: tetratricopeptide repeat protein [Anaeromyxobacteraceae bacterium]|nr:tetratricopeptide repeat protein [Anaeromyxobacteraceae bacterium]